MVWGWEGAGEGGDVVGLDGVGEEGLGGGVGVVDIVDMDVAGGSADDEFFGGGPGDGCEDGLGAAGDGDWGGGIGGRGDFQGGCLELGVGCAAALGKFEADDAHTRICR